MPMQLWCVQQREQQEPSGVEVGLHVDQQDTFTSQTAEHPRTAQEATTTASISFSKHVCLHGQHQDYEYSIRSRCAWVLVEIHAPVRRPVQVTPSRVVAELAAGVLPEMRADGELICGSEA